MAGYVPDGIRTVADVKAHFAECIREAEAGHIIVVSRHGRPVAQLAPIGAMRLGAGDRQPEEVAEAKPPYLDEPSIATSTPAARRAALRALLEKEIWPRIPEELLGKGVSKQELETILGYAPMSSKDDARDRR